MKIHGDSAPHAGRTLIETKIESDLKLKTPLAVRLCSRLVEEGLIDEAERSRYEICFEEALKNSIVHGNQEAPDLSVAVRLFVDDSEGVWGLTVDDEGRGFDEGALRARVEMPTLERKDGWGIRILSDTADRLEYFRGGRTLCFVKNCWERGLRSGPRCGAGATGSVRWTTVDSTTIASIENTKVGDSPADAIFEEVERLLTMDPPHVFILDVSGVSFLSSYAIGRIIALLRTCQKLDTDLRLAGAQPEVRGVFEMTRLDSVLALHDSVEDALRVNA